MKPNIIVIIPAFNEEKSIGKVIQNIPAGLVSEVIVVNNNSNDKTSIEAAKYGATVLDESVRGYGKACLKGLDYIAKKAELEQPGIVVFLDGDYSDFPGEMPLLVNPIISEGYDLVIGSRVLGVREKGALQPHQQFGGWLATRLIKLFWKVRFTDLGPFRAIKYISLKRLNMKDRDYGWTVEMQVKAAKLKMKCTEIPVSYRKRIGVSKVTGTIKGSVLAGYKIITTIFRYAI